jgi:hypothetical protein
VDSSLILQLIVGQNMAGYLAAEAGVQCGRWLKSTGASNWKSDNNGCHFLALLFLLLQTNKPSVDAKSAPCAKHTASRTKLA